MSGINSDWILQVIWRISVQAAAFAVLVWVVTKASRKAPAAWRHTLWLLALIKLLIPPAIQVPWMSPTASVHTELGSTASVAGVVDMPQDASGSQTVPQQPQGPSVVGASTPAPGPTGTGALSRFKGMQIGTLAVWAWAMGIALGIALLALRCIGQRRLVGQISEAPGELRDLLAECAARLGVGRAPRIALSDGVSAPMLVGLLHPVVLLPVRITESCGTTELRAMLMHELAHVRRQDMAVVWLHQLVRVLFFFHPAVWLAGGELERERELACDEMVLSSGFAGEEYASGYLLALRMANRLQRGSVALGMAEPVELEKRRLDLILREKLPMYSKAWAVALVLIGAVCLPSYSGSQSYQRTIMLMPGMRNAHTTGEERRTSYNSSQLREQPTILVPGTYPLQWVPDEQPTGATWIKAHRISAALAEHYIGLESPEAYIAQYGALTIVLDESKGAGRGYDVAYIIDRDAGGPVQLRSVPRVCLMTERNARVYSLRDRNVINGPLLRMDDSQEPVLVEMRVPLSSHARSRRYRLQLDVPLQGDRPDIVQLFLGGAMYSTVDSSDGKIRVRVVDLNGNGVYGDKAPRSSGDELLWKPSGESDPPGRERKTGLQAPAISFDSRLYAIDIDEAARTFTISRYSRSTATLIVDARDGNGHKASRYRILMGNSTGGYRFDSQFGNTIEIPQGLYYMGALVWPARRAANKSWVTPWWDSDTKVHLRSGEIRHIAIGGRADLRFVGGTKRIVARHGETVRVRLQTKHLSAYTQELTPVVVVTRADGERLLQVRTSPIEGGSDTYAASIKIPADWRPGEYRISGKLDLGAYQNLTEVHRTLRVTR